MKWVKIAGEGALGDVNWGATLKRPREIVDKEIEDLKKHLGERVLLTGDGASRGYRIGKLVRVWLENRNGSYCPQVELVNLRGINSWNCPVWEKSFFFYIDSWQISVIGR